MSRNNVSIIILCTLYCSFYCNTMYCHENNKQKIHKESFDIIVISSTEYTIIESLVAVLKNEHMLQPAEYAEKLQQYYDTLFSYPETKVLLKEYIQAIHDKNVPQKQIAHRKLIEHLRAVYNFPLKDLMMVR